MSGPYRGFYVPYFEAYVLYELGSFGVFVVCALSSRVSFFVFFFFFFFFLWRVLPLRLIILPGTWRLLCSSFLVMTVFSCGIMKEGMLFVVFFLFPLCLQ